jgi:hypothetical protein
VIRFHMSPGGRKRRGIRSGENWPAAETSPKESIDGARKRSALGWDFRNSIRLRGDEVRVLLADIHEHSRKVCDY